MKLIWTLSTCRFLPSKVQSLLTLLQSCIPNFILELSSKVNPFYPRKFSEEPKNVIFMPPVYKEPYIFTGYRPRTDFLTCLYSLFWLHNESFNCWSHILGIPMVFFFIFEQYTTFSSPIMYLYLFSCLCFVLGSSFAHTFCCYNGLSHDAFFSIDYIGLSIFSCGSATAYISYSFPLELSTVSGLFGFSFLDTYLILLTFCSMLSIFQSIWTRTLPVSVFRGILRASAFAAPGIFMSIPILYKIFTCLFGTTAYPSHYCDSTVIWPKQFLACITSLVFYVSRFPECLYPGRFDYFGHSHNVFHIGALLGLHYQKTALSLDLQFAISNQMASPSIVIPIICFAVLFASILLTCVHFRHLFIFKPPCEPSRYKAY